MLLKLIKTKPFISGTHAEIWEINHYTSDRLLAEVFILNEHLPAEFFYRLTVTISGICIAGKPCGWQWKTPQDEQTLTDYFREIQRTHEEIRIEVTVPEPNLPGYPHTDYHPDDYPIVFVDF